MLSRGKGSPVRRRTGDRLFTAVLRARGARVGARTIVPRDLLVSQPRGIWVGNDVELRRNSTLDALSSARPAIKIGNGCRLKENVWLASYGGEIELGNKVLVGRNSSIHGHFGVVVEDYVMIGPGVVITSARHGTSVDGTPFQEQEETGAAVRIGFGAWVGANCVVLPGSDVGQNVVVAAGSVVRGRLPAGCLYAGVPAKLVRRLDETSTGASLA